MNTGTFTAMLKKSKLEIGQVFCLLFISLFLNVFENSFPLGYHPDEVKKVAFIKQNTQDFRHPILMLQTVRVVNKVSQLSEDQDIVELGRTTSAIYGALCVLFVFFIFRKILPKMYAFFAALTLAAAPNLVVHAHYLKEDMVFTCFAYLSLLMFIRFLKNRDVRHALYFGCSLGMAISAQYKGSLLLLFFLFIPFVANMKNKLAYYKTLFISFSIAGVVFLLINFPLIFNRGVFIDGFLLEKNHALQGHVVKITPWSQFFSYHFFHSLLPGLSWIVGIMAVWGIVISIYRWKNTGVSEKVLLVYLLFFYFVHEAVPLKPFPDSMRYVLPVIPVMVLFAYKPVVWLDEVLKKKRYKNMLYLLLAAMVVIPLYTSGRLIRSINNDTRAVFVKWMQNNDKNVLYEDYCGVKTNVFSLAEKNVSEYREDGFDYLVASSFVYDRYLFGSKLKKQSESVYERAEWYRKLFKLPYKEITPSYKSFAFSNPTIRIIDIQKKEE